MTLETYLQKVAELGVERGQLDHAGFLEITTLSIGNVPHHLRDDVGPRIPKPPITEDLSRFEPKGRGVKQQAGGRIGGRASK